MAEQIDAETLTEFLDSLRRTIERIAAVYQASDLVCFEICERRLEEHIRILIAISLSHNSSSGDLSGVLEDSLAVLVRKMSDILNASCFCPKERSQLSLSTSTGGRPAYNITKEMIEQLREMLRCAMHHGKDNKDCCSFHTTWRRSSSLCVWRPNLVTEVGSKQPRKTRRTSAT